MLKTPLYAPTPHGSPARGCRRFPFHLAWIPLLVVVAACSPRARPEFNISPVAVTACGDAAAIASKTPGTSATARAGEFDDEALTGRVLGCRLQVDGSFSALGKSEDFVKRLTGHFTKSQWAEMIAYSADGENGTQFAYRRNQIGCLVRGTWDGGGGVAKGNYQVIVLCMSPPPPESGITPSSRSKLRDMLRLGN